MTRKQAILSIQRQVEAATGRSIKASYIGYLIKRDADRWQVEHNGVLYTREATDPERLPAAQAYRPGKGSDKRGGGNIPSESELKNHVI